MNLLKTHEEILERLTEIASKEIGFDERGQFMNLQKMIHSEIGFIEKLKELKEENDSNKLCAYKLGVGKIIIGQRGSGISSTLIDECLKYDRPLIVEYPKRAEQLKKEYQNLKLGYLIKNFNEARLELMSANKEDIKWDEEQISIDLCAHGNDIDIISRTIEDIKCKVGAIGTVGISYEI